MSELPRVVLTNDDGIASPGLRMLAVELEATGRYDLVVAAPPSDMSGSGTGIGGFDPVASPAAIVLSASSAAANALTRSSNATIALICGLTRSIWS